MTGVGTVLITGGAGRLGLHLAKAVADRGIPILFDVKRPATGTPYRFIQDSLLSTDAVTKATEGVDAIVHSAALLSKGNSDEDIFRNNLLTCWNTLSAAEKNGVKNFIFISSDTVTGLYGSDLPPKYLPIDESYPCNPIQPYSISKLLGERLCEAFRQRSSMRIVTLRPMYILYSDDLTKIGEKQSVSHPELWGYVGAEDVASAAVAALIAPAVAPVYNISAPWTLSEIPTLELLKRRFGQVPILRKPTLYEADAYAALFDSSLAKADLGYTAKINWRDVVAKIQ
jgi:nucleoside-diphosphate-sugar epimerase